ncbi:MAG TPA: hypothetical protein VND21_10495 [Planctomycetota bacterium]|nr:hypothetical protein [Planctomycetota bacterium]
MTQSTALLLTLAIEVPIVVGLTVAGRWPRRDVLRLGVTAIGASLLTHPLLWLADAALQSRLAWAPRVALLEVGVTLLEAAAYAIAGRAGWPRGLLLSLVANAASLGTGLLLYA